MQWDMPKTGVGCCPRLSGGGACLAAEQRQKEQGLKEVANGARLAAVMAEARAACDQPWAIAKSRACRSAAEVEVIAFDMLRPAGQCCA